MQIFIHCTNYDCETGDITIDWRGYHGEFPDTYKCPVCGLEAVRVLPRINTPRLRPIRTLKLTRWILQ
jgi:hypothetical protein